VLHGRPTELRHDDRNPVVHPQVPGEADLGYRLLRRHWRRGYATEGARELIRYGQGAAWITGQVLRADGGLLPCQS
jgi:RimJ/RimL family protein N-acetyltransferase